MSLYAFANRILITEGTNTPRKIQYAFGLLAVLVFFQEFVNYISPISFRYLYFLLYAYFLFDATITGMMKNRGISLFGAANLALVGYGLFILGRGPSIGNVTVFVSTTYPMVAYLFVRNNGYLFNPKFYRFTYVLLLFITIFGLFEYFFAQYFLADIVARLGRGITNEYLESGLYLQKVNTNLLGIYRSMSFIMEFVYFGYFGMYCFFIAITEYQARRGWVRLALAALVFFGLFSSVTMSAIGMASVGAALLILWKARLRTKLILGGVVASVAATAISFVLNLDSEFGFKPLLRVTKILSGEDSQVDAHLGSKLESLPLVGNSWQTGYEHEYFDAIFRLGVFGGALYIGIFALFLYKSIRLALRPTPYQAKLIPIALLFIGFLGIGFTHHTLQVGVSVLAFIFLAQIENSLRNGASDPS